MPSPKVLVAISLMGTLASAPAWANAVGPIAPPPPTPPVAPAAPAAMAESREVDAAYERAMNAVAAGTPDRALADLDFVAASSRDANRRSSAAALAARIRAAHVAPAVAPAPATAPPPAAAPPPAMMTPPPSAAPAPRPAEEPDQAGRTVFLATTTFLGLTTYGWTVPRSLDVTGDRSFLALYMLTAGTSFVAPYLLTRHREVSWATTNAAWHGGTRGLTHGLAIAALISRHDNPRGLALAILLGSGLELTGAAWWATATDPTPAKVRTMAWAGDFGLLGGMAIAHLTGLDLHDSHSINDSDASVRIVVASALVGNAAGFVLGHMLADADGPRTTWGDGEVTRAAGVLGAFAGAAVADWFDAFDDEHTRFWVGAMMVGGAGGLYLGHRLGLRADFSVGRAFLVDLGTIAGGLLGAGITYLATPEDGNYDATPFVTAAAGGAILGFALTTWSLGVTGSTDPVTARSTGFTPQLVPLLGHQGQRGVALAGLF